MGRTEALAVFLTLEGLGPPVGAEVGVGPLEESGHLARTSWLNSRTFLAGRESLDEEISRSGGAGCPFLCPCASTCFIRLSARE